MYYILGNMSIENVYKQKRYGKSGKYRGLFTGTLLDGKNYGYGTYTYMNGDKYEGNYENNVRHGYGVYTWRNGNIYSGNWENDSCNGFGILIHEGKRHVGTWINGKRDVLVVYLESGQKIIPKQPEILD